MADLPISQLPAAASLTGAELVPAVQGGNTVQTTVAAIAAKAAATPPGGAGFATQYNNAGALGGVPPGTAGQVLTSNGAAAAPSYQALAPSVIFGQPNFIAPPSAGWTWQQQGVTTVASAYNGVAQLFTIPPSNPAHQESFYERPLSTATFTLTVCFMLAANYMGNANFSRVGLFWRDSIGGKLQNFCLDLRANPPGLSSYRYSSLAAFASTFFAGAAFSFANSTPMIGLPIWLRTVRDVGNNITNYFSSDGLNFVRVGAAADATNYVTAPDRVGVEMLNDSAGSALDFTSWLTLLSWQLTSP